MSNTQNENEYQDGESSQQCLLSPARDRGRGLDVKRLKRTKEEAGSKGTEQISPTSTQQNQRYPQRVPPASVVPRQGRDPGVFGKGKLCWF